MDSWNFSEILNSLKIEAAERKGIFVLIGTGAEKRRRRDSAETL